jgi:hypothetical protein
MHGNVEKMNVEWTIEIYYNKRQGIHGVQRWEIQDDWRRPVADLIVMC